MEELNQDSIIKKLQILWNNFLKDETPAKKEFWAFLFLFEFKQLDQNYLSIGTATFLNSVAFQLTTYMLQLVYKIICDSVSDDQSHEQSNNDENVMKNCDEPKSAANPYENGNISQALFNNPSDITAILSLRKFLTDGLGGPILEYLQNCDIKFLTSRKILATLLINLFPNSAWEQDPSINDCNDNSCLEYEISIPSLDGFINDLLLLRLPNFKKNIPKIPDLTVSNSGTPNASHTSTNKNLTKNCENDMFTPIKAAAASTAVGEINDDIEAIQYDVDEFVAFKAISRKSDEIALLLLNLLQKLVNDENGCSLEENSLTIDSLKFGIENITNAESLALFANRQNYFRIKLKFLFLIQSCLNNVFVKRANYNLINFKEIFASLSKSLEHIYLNSKQLLPQTDQEQLQQQLQLLSESYQTIYEILYLIFALLNNVLLISNYKLDKVINIFKWIDDDRLSKALIILNKLLTELDRTNNSKELFFKKIIEILLQINWNIKTFTYRNDKKMSKKKLKNMNKQQEQQVVNKQMHCKHNQIPCCVEKILLKIFKNLNTQMQEMVVKNFQRNPICCCLYSTETLELFFFHVYDLKVQKQLYTFVTNRFLKTVLLKSSCPMCDSKSKSYELHYDIFKLYKRKYVQIESVSDMLLFLQHILKIANIFTLDISSRILVDIVLPIFRMQKKLYTEHAKECNPVLEHMCSDNATLHRHTDDSLPFEPIDSISSLTINIILECLNIFMLYLNDVRLIKGFFINENLNHLNDLLYVPELTKVVCDLIRVGIENASFLGETADEKYKLNQRLFEIQLTAVDNCSNLLMQLWSNFQTYFEEVQLCMMECDAEQQSHLKMLYEKKKLNLSQIFYMTTIFWSCTIELYRVNHMFRKQFQKTYSSISNANPTEDVQSDEESDAMGSADFHLRFKQNKLYILAYNSLCLYLYYNQTARDAKSNTYNHNDSDDDGNHRRNQCKELLQNISQVLLSYEIRQICKGENIYIDDNNLSGITLYSTHNKQTADKQYLDISCCCSSTAVRHVCDLEKTTHSSAMIPSMQTNRWRTQSDCDQICNYFLSAATSEPCAVLVNCDTNYISFIDRYREEEVLYEDSHYCIESSAHSTFLNQFKYSDDIQFIFDISNQRLPNSNLAGRVRHKALLEDTQDRFGLFGLFGSAIKSLKDQLPKLETLFGSENGSAKHGSDCHLNEACDKDRLIEEKNRIDENLLFLCLPGDGKLFLLKIFEFTFNIFLLDNFELKDCKMQLYLNQLKSLILYQSQRHWAHIENANATIQALQSLLKIAEIANKSMVASNSSLANESQRSIQIQINANPRYDKECDKLQSPNPDEDDGEAATMLSGRISFLSEDLDFHSSKASCSHLESEIELSENDTEEYYVTADEGYEADAEIQEVSETDETNEKLWNSFVPLSKFRTFYVHEGICKIVVEILIELSLRCIKNPNFWTSSLNQLANKLFFIKESLGGPLFLIKGFTPILICNDSRLKDFQQSILDLITDLNTPDVLSAYLGLFTHENPPVDILMRYMSFICSNVIIQPKAELVFPLECDGSISSTCNPLLFEQIEKIRNYHEYHSVMSPFTESACILPITHSRIWATEGFTLSTWIQIKKNKNILTNPLPTIEDEWSSNQSSHIVSFGSNQIMLSIYVNANNNLLFETTKPNAEICTDSNSEDVVETKQFKNDFVLRRKRKKRKIVVNTTGGVDGGSGTNSATNKENFSPAFNNEDTQAPSSEKSSLANALKSTKMAIINSFNQFSIFNTQADQDEAFENTSIELKYFKLVPQKWTHLCFAIEIKPNLFNITVIIDGSEQYLISLPCLSLQNLLKNETLQLLCVGMNIASYKSDTNLSRDDKLHSNVVEYSLSNILLFDKAFENKSLVSSLTALGPDALNLTQCQVGNTIPNYGLLNFNKTYKYNYKSFKESIKNLKHNLIVSYSVYEPKVFSAFARQEKVDESNSFACVRCGVIYYGTNFTVKRIRSIQTATLLSGGLASILFLFARVVELTADSDIQAMALDFVLNVALHDSKLYTEFVKRDYLSLISYVIKTDQCSKDVNLLKSFINNSCTEPVITKRNNNIQINETTTATIIYPHIIVSIIQKYSDWYRSGAKESKVLDTLLKTLQYLLREKHPHQQFNMQQLNNAGFIKELLNLCKIYVIEATNPVYISINAAESFTNIISIFAGSPPIPSLLDEIMKLLLVLQRPSDCFITHDRSKFYFLISPDPPIKHKKISLPLPSRQLRALMRERKKSSPVNSALSMRQALQHTGKSLDPRLNQASDREKGRISFSRSSVERQTTNLTNILNNMDTLEIIADCSRLSRSTMEYFKNKGKDDKFRQTLNCISTSLKFSPKLHRSITNCPNRVIKTRRYSKSKTPMKIAPQNNDANANNSSPMDSKNKPSPKKRNRKKSYLSIQLDIMASTEYDVVQSDEVSTTNESVHSSSSPTRRRKFRHHKKNEFYNQEGIIKLQESLYLLLKDFILILPDSSIEEVLSHYVKIEIILVLANHPNTSVRSAIIRLLATLCERMPSNELHSINKKFYWTHCANQLAIHKGDKTLCEAALQWLTGKCQTLEDLYVCKDIKIHSKFAVQSFLAVLIQSIGSCDEVIQSFAILKTIFQNDTTNNSLLIENGLMQICVKSLHKLFLLLKQINLKLEESIISLLSVIAIKSIKSPNHMHILWEIMNLLAFYEENDIDSVVRGFRGVQATILSSLLKIFLFVSSPKSKGRANPMVLQCNLSASEVRTRFELLVDKCSQFFIISDSMVRPVEAEIKLFEQLVKLCVTGYTKCNNFIAWGLLPSRPIHLRMFIVNNLWRFYARESHTKIVCDAKMLRSLLWLFANEEKPNESDSKSAGLYDNLDRLCKRLAISENDFWNVETELDKIEMNRENLMLTQKPSVEKTVYKYESIIQSCIDSSMVITRVVAELQNSERKSLMGQMKERDERYSFQEWIAIVQRMTHEGAPWFNENNYSRSWELDDTEGPARVRMRLRRCELDLDRRFIMDEYYRPIASKSHPLDYLITAGDQQLNISLNSQVLYNFQAKYLPVDGEIDGELVITDTKVFFLSTYHCKLFYVNFEINKICEIWTKRYQHEECSLEFFLDSNRSLFFAIKNKDDWKTIKDIFGHKIIPHPDQNKVSLITQQWREGLLTNWEYLMTLNHIAGRTYNDLMQYPVFPWVLSNYSSKTLDLTDRNNFRKFEKPIAIQSEDNEKHFIDNYNDIENTVMNIGSVRLKPYHYNSLYSNSGTVLHFLVRLPPFTNYFLRYQDNKFDLADRTFHSINTLWKLASRESNTDVKELIPEFFYLPEMFENFEKFNFGNRQSGELVNNVQLPQWCSNDSRTFVLIHRQALESEIVRNSLHHWIDLIFGFKQTGPAALEAINVFHPATYPEFLTQHISNPNDRKACETMVKQYGQIPRQLMKTAHPASKLLNYSLGRTEPKTSVKGLRWGAYTGSPQCTEPELSDIHTLDGVSHLIAFPSTNVVYGLPKKCCIMQGPECDVFNLISWNHDDGLIRMQSLSEFSSSSKPLMFNSSFDEITTCGADANSNALWFGHKSGKISIYQCTSYTELNRTLRSRQTALGGIKLSYNSAFRKFSMKSNNKSDDYEKSLTENVVGSTGKNNLESADQITWKGPVILIRHTDEVNCIVLSIEFKIAVSAGRDGLAVIWDLNNFNYIRTIERPSEIYHSPISLLAISPTLGDIVTIHSIEKPTNTTFSAKKENLSDNEENDCFEATEESIDGFVNVSTNPNGKSVLRLHSVNAKYVKHIVHEEKILSVCYSYIKEGTGINVIATGIEGGIIRLWSSWDLSFVNQINANRSEIISLTYSSYQHLIVLTKDGFLQVWESKELYGNAPKFPQINFNNR